VAIYDPSDVRWSRDPGPMHDEIRERAPIQRTEGNYWVLARHRDVLAVLRDRRTSSDSLNIEPGKEPSGFAAGRADVDGPDGDPRPFLFRDPPDHTRLRSLVQRAFTPRRVAELTPYVTRLAEKAVDAHLGSGEFDAVQEMAWPVPVAVICEMLNIPEADHASFQAQSALLARGLDPEFLLAPEDREARDLALLHFIAYFSELANDRRQSPGDDLLSGLIAARDGEDQLSEAELLSTAILLLVAGHETTMNLISGSLLAFSADPVAWRSVREGGVDRVAVDELLRLVSPVQLTGRTILEDMEVSGVTLDGGSFALMLIGAANRDPEAFSDPTRLNLAREPNPHLGFGFGLHHCLGAPLARLEAEVLLSVLARRAREIKVVGEYAYRPNIVLRGLANLPLELRT
jgi:cytochrome P450